MLSFLLHCAMDCVFLTCSDAAGQALGASPHRAITEPGLWDEFLSSKESHHAPSNLHGVVIFAAWADVYL